MRILFLTSAHNSMSQRMQVELWERRHEVTVELALSDQAMISAAQLCAPDLIVAPMLKRAIPEPVWRQWVCFIVHPGVPGDRGPCALDWAMLDRVEQWGVTILQADADMDAGDIWATAAFRMRNASKSSLYRDEVVDCAVKALLLAIERFAGGRYVPEKPPQGRLRPAVKQAQRAIDWSESTDGIARKIRCGDGSPGVLDIVLGEPYHLYGAHEEDTLKGAPGEIIASRDGAICRATGDGAVWITHLKRSSPQGIKLPATQALHAALIGVRERAQDAFVAPQGRTWREIRYEESGKVGHLHFDFYSGAMSTAQCLRLRETLRRARLRPTHVLVLWGGRDCFCNGIDLNAIEAAPNPARESWHNINAINDVVLDILRIDDRLVVSALQGGAGAGGAILPLAADLIYARPGVVLNPHYKSMGGLYGSEYWTYLLPRRVGYVRAIELTESLLPVGAASAKRLGLIDDALGEDVDDFRARVKVLAKRWAESAELDHFLAAKVARRAAAEARKPLADYRTEELVRMKQNFVGIDPSYHIARHRFVHKIPPAHTPIHIAPHRRADAMGSAPVVPAASGTKTEAERA